METSVPKIIVENVTKTYGNITVLNNFSAVFEEARTTALMGESGRGKTTLLRILAGLEQADEGKISGITRFNYSFAFQEDRLFPFLNLFENVRLFLPNQIEDKQILRILNAFELSSKDTLLKRPAELSGGMKRRVSIARALLYDKPILLIDEPIKGLDDAMARTVNQIIKEYSKERTTIIATHSLSDAYEFCDNIVTMES